MTSQGKSVAILAGDVPESEGSSYLADFAARVAGPRQRALTDEFGIIAFGVYFPTLPPGTESALRHRHTAQGEFVNILWGELVLAQDDG